VSAFVHEAARLCRNDGDAPATALRVGGFARRYGGLVLRPWRKCEARLNALPQFMTKIDGLDIHFIYAVVAAPGTVRIGDQSWGKPFDK
jgi:hypothetical protein